MVALDRSQHREVPQLAIVHRDVDLQLVNEASDQPQGWEEAVARADPEVLPPHVRIDMGSSSSSSSSSSP